MSDREQFEAWITQYRKGKPYWSNAREEILWDGWQASRRAVTAESIEATSALIANGLLGAAPEEDVREVERLINEMLGTK